jgi:hypothetical protein
MGALRHILPHTPQIVLPPQPSLSWRSILFPLPGPYRADLRLRVSTHGLRRLPARERPQDFDI